jgi:xylulokinase
MTLVAGIDVGTSGAKSSLVEVEGALACERRSVTIGYRRDGAPSRDPGRWLEASLEALERLGLGEDAAVEAVGFTGQMHALVALDGESKPLRPAMLWLDYDGAAQLERFIGDHGEIDMVRRTGNLPLPDFTLAKWLCAVEQTPAIAGSACVLIGAKDYVRRSVCGGTHLTDWNEAAGTQVYDPFNRRWAEEIARAARFPLDALPDVVASTTLTGAAHQPGGNALAKQSVVGTGDQAAASRAVGALQPGVVSLSLGTSGVAASRFDVPELPQDWDGRFHLFPIDAPGGFQLIGTVPSVGPTLRWLSRLTKVPLAKLPALAGSAAGSRSTVRFFPYLGGRGAPNADSEQRGALIGLSETSTSAEVAHAVYLGIAYEIASIIDDMRAVGATIDHVVCSGGAAVDSHLVETIAAYVEAQCSVASGSSASSSGAALLAYDSISADPRASLASLPLQPGPTVHDRVAWSEDREAFLEPVRRDTT